MKILICFLLSFNVFANYMGDSKIGICEDGILVYSKMSHCQIQEGESCMPLVESYNCSFHEKKLVEVDDYLRPIFTRSEVESCSDEDDCLVKLESKICSDIEEAVAMGVLEIFCRKISGYEQKLIDAITVNDSNKLIWDSKVLKEATMRAISRKRAAGQKVINVMVYRSIIKTLTPGQKKQILLTYSDIKELLEVGNLEQAKIEIQAVTPDGTLVTVDDKTELIAEIDKYL